jgi:hypothetical protein
MNQFCSQRASILLALLLLGGWAVGTTGAQAPATPDKPATPAAAPIPAASKTASPVIQPPVPDDKVVLKIADQQFTKAQFDFLIDHLDPRSKQAIATQGKKEFADRYALVVALSQEAHEHHLDETPEFTQKLALQKRQMAAQAAFEEINQHAAVSPEEIQQYYTAHLADYDQVTMRQVVVREKPAQPQAAPGRPAAPASGPGLSPDEAKTRAEAIRKELIAGTDIKKITEEFKAPGDVIIESEPRKVRRGGMRPDMEKVAFALKDGEVSEPQEVPQALVFIQVLGHGRVDLKDVTPEIERTMKQQKVDAALNGIKKNASVWMDDQYFAAPSKPAAGPTLGPPLPATPSKP